MISETYVDVRLTLDDEKERRPFGLVVERFDAGPFQLDEMEIGARASFGFEPEDVSSSPASPVAPSASVCPMARRTSTPAKWRSSVAPASPRRPKCTTMASSSPRCGRRRSARRRGLVRTRRCRPSPRCARSRRPAPAVGAAPATSSAASSSPTRGHRRTARRRQRRSDARRLLLATFPNTAIVAALADRRPRRAGAGRGPPGHRLHRIERRPGHRLGDIAAASGVSSRTVQVAFRQHLDTTPTAYLRKVRLDLAHAELLTACPDDEPHRHRSRLPLGLLLAEPLRRALPSRVRALAERDAAPLRSRPGG